MVSKWTEPNTPCLMYKWIRSHRYYIRTNFGPSFDNSSPPVSRLLRYCLVPCWRLSSERFALFAASLANFGLAPSMEKTEKKINAMRAAMRKSSIADQAEFRGKGKGNPVAPWRKAVASARPSSVARAIQCLHGAYTRHGMAMKRAEGPCVYTARTIAKDMTRVAKDMSVSVPRSAEDMRISVPRNSRITWALSHAGATSRIVSGAGRTRQDWKC